MKNKKLYFLHIPRCGGSYIKKSLRKYISKKRFVVINEACNKYKTKCQIMTPQEIREIKNRDDCILFSTIRNPYDLLVSYYTSFYHTSNKGEDTRGRMPLCSDIEIRNINNGHIDLNYGCDFKTFLNNFINNKELEKNTIQYYQSKFLYYQLFDNDGKCCVDKLLRTENLSKELKELCEEEGLKLNISENNQKFNTSRIEMEGDYKSFYNDDTRKLVETHCYRELIAFGYKFDGIRKEFNLDKIRYNPHTNDFSLEV